MKLFPKTSQSIKSISTSLGPDFLLKTRVKDGETNLPVFLF